MFTEAAVKDTLVAVTSNQKKYSHLAPEQLHQSAMVWQNILQH